MIFNKAYNIESRKDFLNYLRVQLFEDNLIENIKPIQIDKTTIFFEESSCFKLGEINLDKKVSIFEIKQKSKNDPRVTLTRDAFKVMEDLGVRNALIVFYSKDSSSWRLSLLTLKKSWGEKETSNPKRYSFLLGDGEKTRTPEKYLSKIVLDFEDLVSRFDVEVVRKEFFNDYLTLYIRLYKAITDDIDFIKLLNSQKIEVVSFTKNLLGKIVFLYFIQKKGWLGVKRDGKYGEDGDKNFMRSMWKDFISGEKTILEKHGYFYNDYLEWLFFAGLNKDNTDNDDFNEYFNQKVPYLNGGLFKEDYKGWIDNISQISNDIFSNKNKDGILDTFDLYNFTIDEDDLYDSNIAIDPEMLGRIFEKMIGIDETNIEKIVNIYDEKAKKRKDGYVKMDIEKWNVGNNNKKLGAFYTPREIVHYMTKESIIHYLINNLQGKKEYKEKQIRTLLEVKEKFLVTKADITEEVFDKLANIIEKVDYLLQKVKILDPAVGSGAFPMGILHEISTIRYYIYGTFYKTFGMNSNIFKNEQGKISMYKIKRDIIQNNIYGVDISSGAIDIARLRFWLSLVVDEETPEPLPNFEFKFVCTNTLIPLAEEKEQVSLELGGVKELNVETLRKYMLSYYNANGNKDKEEWKLRIESFLGIGKNLIMDFHNVKSQRTKQLETYEPFNSNHSAKFFDPSLMMGNGKFDIVIGNPPYGVSIKGDYRKIIEKVLDKVPDYEIYYYFIEIAYKFLKQNGINSYIIPNTVLFNVGAEKYRTKILEKWGVEELLDCTNFEIFENATVRNIITLFSKDNSRKIIGYRNTKNINDFPSMLMNERKYLSLDNINANLKNWGLAFKLDKITINLVLKIKNSSLPIVKFFTNISQGLIAYDKYKGQSEEIIQNRAYHYLSNDKEGLKKWIYGGDVKRYNMTWNGKEYIDYCNGIANPRTSNYFNENRILVREITNPRIFSSYVEGEYYNDPAIINILEGELSIKYLLGILNSKLITFFHFNSSPKATKGAFPKILVTDIKNFPIKDISEEKQKPFIKRVDKILEITKQSFYDPKNPPKEQLELEREIDEMVYELYGLSEEEINVVEESLK